MKIERVKITKFKALEQLEAELKGRNVLLIGDNDLGKSSFMQFIRIALGDQTDIPPDAAGEGYVIANKNGEEYRFHVEFKKNKPVITVTAPNGMKDNRKGFLASIVGAMEFNIDTFVKLSDTTAGRKKQIEIYKSFFDRETLDILEKIEVDVKRHFDDRTELNRKVDQIKAYLKESKLFGDDLKIQKIDVSAVQTDLQLANDHNASVRRITDAIPEKRKKGQQLAEEKQRLLDRIEEIDKEYEQLSMEITKGEEWLTKNAPIDTASLIEQINKAGDHNAKYAEAQTILAKKAELQKLEDEVGEFTALINSQKGAIEDAVKDINVVPGLYYDMEGLLYNGVPVNEANLSTSQIIELGVKMKMAENKDLGILFIEHSESIGSKRWNEILSMAKENDWQIIAEKVERGKEELQIEIMEG